MGKMGELMDFIWLFNAQVNSLHEPMLLTQSAIQKAREFEDKLKRMDLAKEEAGIIEKELENSLAYVREAGKKLAGLEDEVVNMLENLAKVKKES